MFLDRSDLALPLSSWPRPKMALFVGSKLQRLVFGSWPMVRSYLFGVHVRGLWPGPTLGPAPPPREEQIQEITSRVSLNISPGNVGAREGPFPPDKLIPINSACFFKSVVSGDPDRGLRTCTQFGSCSYSRLRGGSPVLMEGWVWAHESYRRNNLLLFPYEKCYLGPPLYLYSRHWKSLLFLTPCDFQKHTRVIIITYWDLLYTVYCKKRTFRWNAGFRWISFVAQLVHVPPFPRSLFFLLAPHVCFYKLTLVPAVYVAKSHLCARWSPPKLCNIVQIKLPPPIYGIAPRSLPLWGCVARLFACICPTLCESGQLLFFMEIHKEFFVFCGLFAKLVGFLRLPVWPNEASAHDHVCFHGFWFSPASVWRNFKM